MARMTREQLGVQAGDSIIIKGKVVFARLDKLVDGDALAKENERRAKLGMLPTKPFRSITIEEPEIVQGQGTPLAQYYGQSVYVSKTTGKQTMTVESKSLYPPQYGHIKDGKIVQIPDPQKNPATGQVVYLLIEAYKPKGFNNLGSSFNAIVFEEGPIQFYEAGNNALAGFGKALNMPVETMQPEPPAEDYVPADDTPETQPSQPQGGQGGNPFGGTPAPQSDNGFGNAPVSEPNNAGFGNAGNAGFGEKPQQSPFDQLGNSGQPQQNPFGGGNNGFGLSDNQASQSPFGNAGQRGNSPFA